MMLPNMAMLFLRKQGVATLGEIAQATGLPGNAIAANLGGLHDYGLVTKLGNFPTSLVRWEGPDTPWVLQQVDKARACHVRPSFFEVSENNTPEKIAVGQGVQP